MSSWSRKCVLVPTDFSEASFEALEEARQIIEDPNNLHLVHVLAPLHPAEPGVVWGAIDDASRTADVEAALRERLAKLDLGGVTVHTRFGDPGHRIAEVAEEIGADLVCISSHGRTGVSRLLLGSVAERVARMSPCPVLIIRGGDS